MNTDIRAWINQHSLLMALKCLLRLCLCNTTIVYNLVFICGIIQYVLTSLDCKPQASSWHDQQGHAAPRLCCHGFGCSALWKRPAFAPLGLCLGSALCRECPRHISPGPYPSLSTVWPKCDVLQKASLCYPLWARKASVCLPPSFSARCVRPLLLPYLGCVLCLIC